MTFKDYFLLSEKFYGNFGSVYHRTDIDPTTHSLFKDGIDRSKLKQGYYGLGLYTTYDLQSQLNERMVNLYGRYIIKARLSLDNMVIFDEAVYKMAYPNGNFEEYLKKYGISKKEIDSYVPYTSNVALKHYNDLLNKCNGLVFTGQQDGKVAVVYNRHNLVPVSYSMDDGKTWNKAEFNLKSIKRPINPNDEKDQPEMSEEEKLDYYNHHKYVYRYFFEWIYDALAQSPKYKEAVKEDRKKQEKDFEPGDRYTNYEGITESDFYKKLEDIFYNSDNHPSKIIDVLKSMDRETYNAILNYYSKLERQYNRNGFDTPYEDEAADMFTALLPFKAADAIINKYEPQNIKIPPILLYSVYSSPQAAYELYEYYYNKGEEIPKEIRASVFSKNFTTLKALKLSLEKTGKIPPNFIKRILNQKDQNLIMELWRYIKMNKLVDKVDPKDWDALQKRVKISKPAPYKV